jgi:hypothetical protein
MSIAHVSTAGKAPAEDRSAPDSVVDRGAEADDVAIPAPLQESESADGHPGTAQPWEVIVSGGGANNEDFDAGGANVIGSVGYFLTDTFELAVRQGVTYSDSGPDSSSVANGATRIAASLHAPLGRVLPYAGASFGWLYGDSVEESLAAGPEVGVKVFVQDSAFFFGNAEWMFLFDDGDSINTAFDQGYINYNVGFGVRF